jgi:hypothetical protein
MTRALSNVSASKDCPTASLVISPASADAIASSGFDGPPVMTELPAELLLNSPGLYRKKFSWKSRHNDLRDAKEARSF